MLIVPIEFAATSVCDFPLQQTLETHSPPSSSISQLLDQCNQIYGTSFPWGVTYGKQKPAHAKLDINYSYTSHIHKYS
jgi:hypothetical protein